MSRPVIPLLLRGLLVTGIAVVTIGAAEAIVFPFRYGPVAVLVPFLAVGALVVAFGGLLPRIDAVVARLTRRRQLTPYAPCCSETTTPTTSHRCSTGPRCAPLW
jgi:hypothetical protein